MGMTEMSKGLTPLSLRQQNDGDLSNLFPSYTKDVSVLEVIVTGDSPDIGASVST